MQRNPFLPYPPGAWQPVAMLAYCRAEKEDLFDMHLNLLSTLQQIAPNSTIFYINTFTIETNQKPKGAT